MRSCFALGFAFIAACGLCTAPACRQQPQSRQYEENSTAAVPPAQVQPQAAPQESNWRWAIPSQWRSEESAGLRLATFSIVDQEGTGQCTLIPLAGDGGGVQANVQRWLEQLQLPRFSPLELEDFLGRQKKMKTNDGLTVLVIDFTGLGRLQEPSRPSMMSAIIPGNDQTLFVKFSGGRSLLEKNREVFYEFCRSLSPGA